MAELSEMSVLTVGIRLHIFKFHGYFMVGPLHKALPMSTRSTSPVASLAEKAPEPKFYVVSVRKMIVMTLFSLGLYFWYWNYRNWEGYRKATGHQVISVLRATFFICYLRELLEKVDQGLCSQGRRFDWMPRSLALGVAVSAMFLFLFYHFPTAQYFPKWIWVLPAPHMNIVIAALYVLSVVLLVLQLCLMAKIQTAINLHEGEVGAIRNGRLTFVNWLWMLPGIFMMVGVVLFIFALFLLSFSIR